MRGLLVTNPAATTSAGWSRDVVVKALSASMQLETVMTERRGHAVELATAARRDGLDLVVTLGGDGTVNEVINGLLSTNDGKCPLLGTIPGGLANVFPRSLGFSADAMSAAGELLTAIDARNTRSIPLGRINGRWFAFNAGIGLDAEVVQVVEQSRATGRKASAGGYALAAVKTIWERLNGTAPHLRVTAVTQAGVRSEIENAYLLIAQNTAPWSYAGPVAVELAASASFERGLDLVALTNLSPAGIAAFFAEGAARLPADRRFASSVIEDCARVEVVCEQPMPVQVDGDSMGEVTQAHLEHVPHALEVLVPRH